MLLVGLLLVNAHAAEALRVLTFNLRYINPGDQGEKTWVARRDHVGEVIKKDAADFIGVQEAFRSMLDDVKTRVPGYAEIGVGREDGKEKGEYSAILYKSDAWESLESGTFWLSDTPDVVASISWGNKVMRICTWGKFRSRKSARELFVFNTHFDHESQQCREKGAALIMKKIQEKAGDLPLVLTGDFNAVPDNPAVRLIIGSQPKLFDVWLSMNATTPLDQSGTINGFKSAINDARIDYIFASAALIADESAILHDQREGNYPSDHFPVRATLHFR